MTKIALLIVYNHRYDKNISIIENLYKNKFAHIYHLMPFYDGNKENVIAVHDNSFYFQGYVAQGFRHFFNEKFTHYLFVADDLLLNPKINENNYAEYFGLDNDSSFIPQLNNIPSPHGCWVHNRDALHFNPFNKKNFNTKGVEVRNLLPTKEDAAEIMEKFGIKNSSVSLFQVCGNIFQQFLYKMRMIVEDIVVYHHFYPKKTSYPLASSYSDIFVVDKNTIAQFSHYCGLFAASKLFAEVAIPSALALSAKRIVTGDSLSMQVQKEAIYDGNIQAVIHKFNFDLSLLMQNFPENQLFIHPIKLSKWK